MADFVAVIRRAVDGLSNNTPEMRVKVYEKARAAVMRQLENMTPKPPEDMLRRQLEKLDAAIVEVEAEYAEALPAVDVAPPEPAFTQPAPAPIEPPPPATPVVVAPSIPVPPAAPVIVEPPAPVAPPVVPVAPAFEQQGLGPSQAGFAAPRAVVPDWHVDAPSHVAPEEPQAAERIEAVVPQPSPVAPPVWQAEPEPPVAAPPREAPLAPPRHPVETWLDDHLEQVAPAPVTASPVPPTPSPPPAPAVAPVPVMPPAPVIPPARAPVFDEASALNEFDAFVRDTAKPAVYGAPPQAEPVSWDAPDRQVSFAGGDRQEAPQSQTPQGQTPQGQAARIEPNQTQAYGDPAWVQDFAAAGVAAGARAELGNDLAGDRRAAPKKAGRDEVAAVLAKAEKRAAAQGRRSAKRSGGLGLYVFGALLVAALGGIGYVAYAHKDNLGETLVSWKDQGIASIKGLISNATPKTTPGQTTSGQTTGGQTTGGQTTPVSTTGSGAGTTGAGDSPDAAGGKFTQRLQADGTEIDPGAGAAAASAGEGRSVAEQTGSGLPSAQAGAAGGAGATGTPQPTRPANTPFTVPENGQRAFLYEEQTGQTATNTLQGYVVWSALRETGESGKAEPVIQGKLTIPDRGLTALITFKRNTDSSLPASHMVEVVFSVPPNFEGGNIDSVQRISMKVAEQDTGDPIVAVPAKITDDTFMIAFNDFADVVSRNVELLRIRDWIDIPITYRNGRRALITLNKGTAGKPIFDNVIREWGTLGNARNGG